jgi:biopolymer transport protein ExbD
MTPKSRKSHAQGISEVNMTPLIDVSLVLVVMLLLATPLAFESSIAVRRAAASAREAEMPSIDQRVEIRVVSEQDVVVNNVTVPRKELSRSLRPLFEEGRRMVVVSCNDQVSHGTFISVLDQAKLSGAKEIAVTGR